MNKMRIWKEKENKKEVDVFGSEYENFISFISF